MDSNRLWRTHGICYLACLLLMLFSTSCLADINAGSYYIYTDISDNIQQLSDEICADCTSDAAKAKAIINWTIKNIKYNYIEMVTATQDNKNHKIFYVDVDEVIEDKKGICLKQASVCMMLMRAQGIEARLGLVQNGGHAVCIFVVNNKTYEADITNQVISRLTEDTVIKVMYED